jgi:arabinogalactan endo-1,4-beta-galactosidase
MQAVADVPDQRGKGIFYWEPTWIAVPGNTWATPAGMKYIHDEWKRVMPGKIRRCLIARKSITFSKSL